jgi:hypothetical protein
LLWFFGSTRIWRWTGLVPRNYWASHTSTIGPTDPIFVQPISVKLAQDPQIDMAGPSLRASIGTRVSRLRRDLNRPANKKHVFPLPKV